ncbi:MAG: HEAT repeat domain-containing protein [Pirellulaceae bacterium]
MITLRQSWIVSLVLLFGFVSLGSAQNETNEEFRPIETLIESLDSREEETRRDAAYELWQMGPPAANSAIPALIKALSDRDDQVSSLATEAIAVIGPPAADAVDVLVDRLRQRDDQVRYRSAFALGSIGPAAVSGIQFALKSEDQRQQEGAATAVRWLGAAAEPILADLAFVLGSDQDAAEAAVESLSRLGSLAVPTLLQRTSDEAATVRANAADALRRMDQRTVPDTLRQNAADRLQELVQDTDPIVRRWAVAGYGKYAADPASVANVCASLLQDADTDVKRAAVMVLADAKAEPEETAKCFAQLLDGSQADREIGLTGLRRMGPAASSVIDSLLSQLQKQPADADAIASTLAAMGDTAVAQVLQATAEGQLTGNSMQLVFNHLGEAVEPQLQEVLQSDDESNAVVVALNAASAIGGLQPETVDAVVRRLSSANPAIQGAAADAVRKLGVNAETVAGQLKSMLSSDDEKVQAAALAALMARPNSLNEMTDVIQQALTNTSAPIIQRRTLQALSAKDAIPASYATPILTLLKAKDELTATSAALCLSKLDEFSDAAAAAIVAQLEAERSPEFQLAAVRALAAGKSHSAAAVSALGTLADSADLELHLACLKTFAEIGSDAKSVMPDLFSRLEHNEPDVRSATLEAIFRISDSQEQQIQTMAGGLSDENWAVRKKASELLGELGSEAAPAVPAILERLVIREDSVFAGSALRAIDKATPEAIPKLLDILKTEDDRRARYYALHLLRKIGPEAKSALPMLREIESQPDLDSRAKDLVTSAIEN